MFLLYFTLLSSLFIRSMSVMTNLDTKDTDVIIAASLALKELTKLSDSGVYSTLSILRIVSASSEIGIYHRNTVLELELASPHFRSGYPSETFEMYVMQHLEDGLISYAIDAFPVMDEKAVEEYYVQKVERRRRVREASFRVLELDSMLPGGLSGDGFSLRDTISSLGPRADDMIKKHSAEFQLRIRSHASLLAEEVALSSKRMEELHDISMGAADATDFQRYRSRQIIDEVIAQLRSVEAV